MGRKPTDQVHLRLRFDEELRAKLEEAAGLRGDSLNAEIVRRLRESFKAPSLSPGGEEKLIEEVRMTVQATLQAGLTNAPGFWISGKGNKE